MFRLLVAFLLFGSSFAIAQNTFCPSPVTQHIITSKHLQEKRSIWVSLPFGYNDSRTYRTVYVLDAEWRFDLVRQILFDQGANQLIEPLIVVGIPHVDWEFKRGQDLTFSQSRIEYDGDTVDSTWYNNQNSGLGIYFYNFLQTELIPLIDEKYSTNSKRSLVGHSYGGYFAAYLLTLENPFDALYIFDPSFWYSDGEVTKRLSQTKVTKPTKVYLSYQKDPDFHCKKIRKWVKAANKQKALDLEVRTYKKLSHNALYLPSILWSFGIYP